MNSGINLIGEKNKTQKVVLTRLKIMRGIAVGLLFLVSVSSVALFILITLSPLPTLQSQEKTAIAALSQQRTEIAKLAVVNERSNTIATIMSTRPNFDGTIDFIKSKLPARGVSITAFAVDKSTVSVTVSSKSLALMNEFINKLLQSSADNKQFSRITLADLSIDNDSFSLKVNVTSL